MKKTGPIDGLSEAGQKYALRQLDLKHAYLASAQECPSEPSGMQTDEGVWRDDHIFCEGKY